MGIQVTITYTNGDVEKLVGYSVRREDGVLRVRTSPSGSYQDTWSTYPLANIRNYTTEG